MRPDGWPRLSRPLPAAGPPSTRSGPRRRCPGCRRRARRVTDRSPSMSSSAEGMPKVVGAGSRVGEYRIDHVVGHGGTATVYAATHLALGRRVALKVVPARMDEPELREQLRSEARLQARVEHPNVVPIYDVGELDSCFYFAMRLVDGVDLGVALGS